MKKDRCIRTEDVKACLLCRAEGEPLYAGLRDRLCGAPGIWSFRKCFRCGLIWLDPRPTREDLGMVYANYQTHSLAEANRETKGWRARAKLAIYSAAPGFSELAGGWTWRILGRVSSWIPPLDDVRYVGLMTLGGFQKGVLLEVGCGNGFFLSLMKKAGWQVTGVEPDPIAANLAREWFVVPVITGTLPDAAFPDGNFDAVVLSHVIEHVYDPVGLLKECHRVVKPGGRIVVVTPNAESRGHNIFRDAWHGLDPPRHFHIFSPQTLHRAAELSGIHMQLLRTSCRIARGVWTSSRIIKNHGYYEQSDVDWLLRFQGLAFQLREEWLRRTYANVGEELVLVASRVK